nr:hypothetical protein [Corynebacterium diphtheriae]
MIRKIPAMVVLLCTGTRLTAGHRYTTLTDATIAVWALVIGIIALVSLLLVVPPLLLGPIGIIISIIALLRGKKRPKELRCTWMSVVGLITSILALAGSIGVMFLGDTGADKCLNMHDPAQQQACMEKTLGIAPQQ